MAVLVFFIEEKHATGMENTGKFKYVYINAVTETQ